MLADGMVYCIVCKDLAMDKRYAIKVSDTKINNGIDGFVCRHCFNKFIESHSNKGFFKVSDMPGWTKKRHGDMRVF